MVVGFVKDAGASGLPYPATTKYRKPVTANWKHTKTDTRTSYTFKHMAR